MLVYNYQGGVIFVCRDKQNREPILFELIGERGVDGVPHFYLNGKEKYCRLLIRKLNIIEGVM